MTPQPDTYTLRLDSSAFRADMAELRRRLGAFVAAPNGLADISLKFLDHLWTTDNAQAAPGTTDIVVPLKLSQRGHDLLAALRAFDVDRDVPTQHGGSSQEVDR